MNAASRRRIARFLPYRGIFDVPTHAVAMSGRRCVSLPSGNILYIGGDAAGGADVEMFSVKEFKLKPLPNLTLPVALQGVGVVYSEQHGLHVLSGTIVGGTYSTHIYRLETVGGQPATESDFESTLVWVSRLTVTGRARPSVAIVKGYPDLVLFCGGSTGGNPVTSFLYNMSANTWTAVADMPAGGIGCAISVQAGKVLVFAQYSKAFAYDVATDAWTTLPLHPVGTFTPYEAVLIDDSTIVVSRDSSHGTYYDYITNTWGSNMTRATLNIARYNSTSLLALPSGRILENGQSLARVNLAW